MSVGVDERWLGLRVICACAACPTLQHAPAAPTAAAIAAAASGGGAADSAAPVRGFYPCALHC